MRAPKSTRREIREGMTRTLLKKQFDEGDKVILFNFKLRLFLDKLKSPSSGPFQVTKVHPHGVVEV